MELGKLTQNTIKDNKQDIKDIVATAKSPEKGLNSAELNKNIFNLTANNSNIKQLTNNNNVFTATGNTTNVSLLSNVSVNDIKNSQMKLVSSYLEKEIEEETNGLDEDVKIETAEQFLEYRDKLLAEMDKTFSEDYILALADEVLNINGEIDESVKQQGTGDCYFLTTLNTLNGSEEGRSIIKDSISHDEEKHTYTVNFPGVEQSYTFTSEEIAEAEEKRHTSQSTGVVGEGSGWYSEGDDDVLLLEMAFEKFREECSAGKFDDKKWPDYAKSFGSYDGVDSDKSALASGGMNQVIYALTGKEIESSSGDEISAQLDKIANKDSNSYAVYASVSAANGYQANAEGDYYKDANGRFQKVTSSTPEDVERYSFTGAGSNDGNIVLNGVGDSDGQTIEITGNSDGGHALAVTNVTEDTITVINPWDSSKEVTVSREDFEGYMNRVDSIDLAGDETMVAKAKGLLSKMLV